MNDQGPKEISRGGRATIEERFSISVRYIRKSGCLGGREVLLEWRRENEVASITFTGDRENIQFTWHTPGIYLNGERVESVSNGAFATWGVNGPTSNVLAAGEE